MTWPRVNGLRSIELGFPGELRDRLNALVLQGRKRATAGLLLEYEREGEELEHVGERLVLLDSDRQPVGTIEITGLAVLPFIEIPWEFAAAEGEGDADLEEWRTGHRRYWAQEGNPVEDDTQIVCLRFTLV